MSEILLMLIMETVSSREHLVDRRQNGVDFDTCVQVICSCDIITDIQVLLMRKQSYKQLQNLDLDILSNI